MSTTHQRLVSARHALTAEEFAFCKVYAAFGEENAAEAYRRAFCIDLGGEVFAKDGKGEAKGDALDARKCSRLGVQMAAQAHIQAFLVELRNPAGDHARDTYAEQVLFGEDDQQRLRAAEKVLKEEDKLGFRDAVEQWAEINCAIGTEVVVPLPGGQEVLIDLRDMYPQYATALPPRDVLVKTMKSLDMYLWTENGRAKGEEEPRDPREWTFLAGFNEFNQMRTEEEKAS